MRVVWFDHQREPQCAPDPKYPNGIDVDLRRNTKLPGCLVELPYPAARCGVYLVVCEKCDYSAAITTAGRPDDPRQVILPCQETHNVH
jgi:hypothetical protein